MTLEYTPELIDYRLQSYKEDGKHYLTGYLLGTKTGDKGWGVHKDTFIDNTKQFEKYPFIVSPKKFDPTEHFLVGATYEEQMEKQKPVVRGEIEEVFGPFPYNDGTDDIFMKFRARIDDEEISEALLTGRLPFGTSPYIWPTDEKGNFIKPEDLTAEERAHVKYWKPVHEALVTQGTFGDIAKIGKQCLGPQGVCKQALAGSSENVAEYLSSQIHLESQQNTIMSNEQNVQKPAETQTTTVQIPAVTSTTSQAPIVPQVQTEQKEDKKEVNEEFETLKKELEAEKKTNQKLLTIHKTSVLKSVFTNFESEDVQKEIIKKYIDQDADLIAEVASDVLKYGIPKKMKKEVELAGSSKDNKETFSLAGNSQNMSNKSRLGQHKSLTSLLGGPL